MVIRQIYWNIIYRSNRRLIPLQTDFYCEDTLGGSGNREATEQAGGLVFGLQEEKLKQSGK